MKDEIPNEQQQLSAAELAARVAELEQTVARIRERNTQIDDLGARLAAAEAAKCAKVAELRARLAEVEALSPALKSIGTGANVNQQQIPSAATADSAAALEIQPAETGAASAAAEAGGDIMAGGGIVTGGDIEAGSDIEAGGDIVTTTAPLLAAATALNAAVADSASAAGVEPAAAARAASEAEPGSPDIAATAVTSLAAGAALTASDTDADTALAASDADAELAASDAADAALAVSDVEVDVDAPEHLHWRLGNLEGVEEPVDDVAAAAAAAEPVIDLGLPIPTEYDVDLMRAMVQDPFHLFVHWQLKGDPYEKLRLIFPAAEVAGFHTVLRLIDEGTGDAAFFDAPFAREHWFNVFPDHTYRVELGLRSERYGFVKLLGSQSVAMPRGGPSDTVAEEVEYHVEADEYLTTLRESYTPKQVFAAQADVPDAALPQSFRNLGAALTEVEAAGDFDHLWERLEQLELSTEAREFLAVIKGMGGGELGYLLVLRYLPELLRRTVNAESEGGAETDQPALLYLIEQQGQGASERLVRRVPQAPGSIGHGPWLPSLTI